MLTAINIRSITMAQNITVKVIGGDTIMLSGDFATVGEVKEHLERENFTAQVNAEAADDNTELNDADFIVLSQPVKGG